MLVEMSAEDNCYTSVGTSQPTHYLNCHLLTAGVPGLCKTGAGSIVLNNILLILCQAVIMFIIYYVYYKHNDELG